MILGTATEPLAIQVDGLIKALRARITQLESEVLILRTALHETRGWDYPAAPRYKQGTTE